ncbi:MAG: helix-turn-helix domain-containing protein [Myxococcota bacterium]
MRVSRLLTIVGPTVTLYVIAARFSLGVATGHPWLLGLLALLLSLMPLRLVWVPPPRASEPLAFMAAAFAVAVASSGVDQGVLAWTHGGAWLAACLTALGLGLRGLLRNAVRALSIIAAGGVGIVLALVFPTPDPGDALASAGLACLVAAGFAHMLSQFRSGHRVEGVLIALAMVSVAVSVAVVWIGSFTGEFEAVVESSVAAVLWLGHLAWVDPEHKSLRRSGIAFVTACLVSFGVGLGLASSSIDSPTGFGTAFAAIGIVWWAVYNLTQRLSARAAWAAPGGLADYARTAKRNLLGLAGLDEIAVGVLSPFAKSFDVQGCAIYALHPLTRIRLGDHGQPQIRSTEAPETWVRGALDAPTGVLDFVALRARVVREPGIRELVDSMARSETGVIVRCTHLDHVEAFLTIPLGSREEPLTTVELQALGGLGHVLGGALSSGLAQRRAESHIRALSSQRRDAEDRVSALEGELAQLRSQFDVFGQGLADEQSLHVAYSARMRDVQMRAIELAATSEPVLLVARAGAPALPVARFIHDRGPRWEGPFVIRDCTSWPAGAGGAPRTDEAAPDRFEWGEGVQRGTLVLRDVPALPREAQRELGAWLREGRAETEDVRLVAISRLPVHELTHRGIVDADLAAMLSAAEVKVPSLRDRREDVPSLVLFAIDRACRVLGSEPIGIDQEAMSKLVAHDWPGDVAELDFIIESAVSRAQGSVIAPADLPPLTWPSANDGVALDGTYTEVERRLLERALLRAGGNKSEAARILGLKRTTFVDKLRRLGVDKSAPSSAQDRAAS